MTRRQENARIVGEYVRARLVLECRVRGRAAQIARETGFAPIQISRVIRGQRTVGFALAKAMADVWGHAYETLEKMAFDAHRLPLVPAGSTASELPNLQKTIDWCLHEKVYPPRFLQRYEREVQRERSTVDRTAREWMLDIEAKFAALEAERRERPGNHDERRPARRMRSREERSGTFAKHGVFQPNKRTGTTKTGRAAT
jgi:hypothetical protein